MNTRERERECASTRERVRVFFSLSNKILEAIILPDCWNSWVNYLTAGTKYSREC